MPGPITPFQIKSLLFDHGISIDLVYCGDRLYLPTTENWIRKFKHHFKTFCDIYLGKPKAEAADCDDFVAGLVFLALSKYAKTSKAPKNTTLAVGFFEYITRNNVKHVDAIFLCRGNAPTRPVFVDPFTGEIKTLTEKEIKSCSNVCFSPLYYPSSAAARQLRTRRSRKKTKSKSAK